MGLLNRAHDAVVMARAGWRGDVIIRGATLGSHGSAIYLANASRALIMDTTIMGAPYPRHIWRRALVRFALRLADTAERPPVTVPFTVGRLVQRSYEKDGQCTRSASR